jgi:hypothetical protein
MDGEIRAVLDLYLGGALPFGEVDFA